MALGSKTDTIEVQDRSLVEPVGGAKPEPEQMPAKRKLYVGSQLGLSNDPNGALAEKPANPQGEFKTSISYEAETHVMAANVGKECHSCIHFDNLGWLRYVQERSSQTHAEFREVHNALNYFRSRLPDGEEDEHIKRMGICRFWTHVCEDEIVCHPYSTCPQEYRTKSGKMEPAVNMYAPRDSVAGAQRTKAFDNIMRLAQGKK